MFPLPPILHFYVHKKCTIYPKLKKRHLFPSYSRRQDNIVHEMRTIVSHLRRDNIVHFEKWTIFAGSKCDSSRSTTCPIIGIPGSISMLSQCCANIVKPTCNIGSPVRTTGIVPMLKAHAGRGPRSSQQWIGKTMEMLPGQFWIHNIGVMKDFLIWTKIEKLF